MDDCGTTISDDDYQTLNEGLKDGLFPLYKDFSLQNPKIENYRENQEWRPDIRFEDGVIRFFLPNGNEFCYMPPQEKTTIDEPNIQLEVIKEYDDGSADAVVNFNKAGLSLLVEAGILSILKQYIDQKKETK